MGRVLFENSGDIFGSGVGTSEPVQVGTVFRPVVDRPPVDISLDVVRDVSGSDGKKMSFFDKVKKFVDDNKAALQYGFSGLVAVGVGLLIKKIK